MTDNPNPYAIARAMEAFDLAEIGDDPALKSVYDELSKKTYLFFTYANAMVVRQEDGDEFNWEDFEFLHDQYEDLSKFFDITTSGFWSGTSSAIRERGSIDPFVAFKGKLDVAFSDVKDIFYKEFIEEDIQSEGGNTSLDLRLEKLEAYAKLHNGDGLAAYARTLFPELVALYAKDKKIDPVPEAETSNSLPTSAPIEWKKDKQPGETPPDFIRRGYGEWLGKGLTRADIRTLDRPLWQALYNWLRENEMPADVDLPTLKEQNSRWIDRLEKEGLSALPGDVSTDFLLREAKRLHEAKRRREGP